MTDGVDVRLLSRDPEVAIDQIGECVRIQAEANWHSEIVPSHVFRADSINLVDSSIDLGYVVVALKRDSDGAAPVVGFARVTFTADPGKHWLHEIVVSPQLQSRGVGWSILKEVRSISLSHGAEGLYFTYDPFEGKNGRLYLSKGGAKGIRVYDNFYGRMKGPAHSNRKTHRFLVRWDLHRDRQKTVEEVESIEVTAPVSGLPLPRDRRIAVEIPNRVQELSPAKAARWQDRVFPVLVEAVNKRGFKATYLLRERDERNFLILEK